VSICISIISVVLTLIIIVGFHELGHFLAARLMGVKVLRFSIGFGKTLLRYQDKQGTEYALSLIPLGGYVKLLDENEASVPDNLLPFAYNKQPLLKKLTIILAGPIFNFILAFFIYWVVFMTGFVSLAPIVSKVTPGSIADRNHFPVSSEILAVDNVRTLNWTAIIIRLLNHAGEDTPLLITIKDVKTYAEKNLTLAVSGWKLDDYRPDPLISLGLIPYEPVIPANIGIIEKNSPAEISGLKVKDLILGLNSTLIQNWFEFATLVHGMPNQNVQVRVLRDNHLITIPLSIGQKKDWHFTPYGYIGISPHFIFPPELLRTDRYAFIPAAFQAIHEVALFTRMNVLVIKKIFLGKISLKSLSGPLSIVNSAGASLNNGFLAFMSFLAFLSVSIGFVNLLPIPGLDGGHVLFLCIAAIIRRPLSDRTQILMYKLGILLLLALMTQSLVNDFMRL
jgi:regulator of sigma E protease